MTELTVTTHTIGEGLDAITYDIRGDLTEGTADRPVLLMVGSPMDASGFGTLAGFVTDRPGVTHPARPPAARARAGCRRPAPRDRGPGRRTCRRVRQQRWRRQHARAGRRPP